MYEETFSHTNLTNEWYLVRLRATEVNNDATLLHDPVFYVRQIFMLATRSSVSQKRIHWRITKAGPSFYRLFFHECREIMERVPDSIPWGKSAVEGK